MTVLGFKSTYENHGLNVMKITSHLKQNAMPQLTKRDLTDRGVMSINLQRTKRRRILPHYDRNLTDWTGANLALKEEEILMNRFKKSYTLLGNSKHRFQGL